MSREQSFVFGFSVNDEFAAAEPDAAAKYIEIAKQRIARRLTAVGPRGGTYRLVTPPDGWRMASDGYDAWRGQTRYSTRRTGRYVRPSRAPILFDALLFDTLTISVGAGTVTLPNGELVETDAQFVDVPVMA